MHAVPAQTPLPQPPSAIRLLADGDASSPAAHALLQPARFVLRQALLSDASLSLRFLLVSRALCDAGVDGAAEHVRGALDALYGLREGLPVRVFLAGLLGVAVGGDGRGVAWDLWGVVGWGVHG